ncbi:hypothetical protein LEQ_1826 [Ligilactobacillus equi DPC 6820]|uniref:Uncharacterized protein n=2 Tax=Ligilactobacillus equi TaxID=137357 RepID=V7HTC5_9LACO|nr:hypothetical protein LEQ_1826 [Ligilactobacillus equi DPC 6820]
MMYLVGEYLKLHGYPHLKNVVYLGIYFLASLANLLISDSLSWVKVRFLHGDDKLFLGVVIAYTNPLLVLEAVCLFIWLLRFPIKSLWLQKSLLSLSPLSFGAYLLQTNPFVYTIITGAYTRLSIMKPWWLVLAVLGLAILWLLAGCLLDYVRNLIFRKLKTQGMFNHKVIKSILTEPSRT